MNGLCVSYQDKSSYIRKMFGGRYEHSNWPSNSVVEEATSSVFVKSQQSWYCKLLSSCVLLAKSSIRSETRKKLKTSKFMSDFRWLKLSWFLLRLFLPSIFDHALLLMEASPYLGYSRNESTPLFFGGIIQLLQVYLSRVYLR